MAYLKCLNEDCPSRNQCYHYISKAIKGQRYMRPKVNGKKCEYFEVNQKKKK